MISDYNFMSGFSGFIAFMSLEINMYRMTLFLPQNYSFYLRHFPYILALLFYGWKHSDILRPGEKWQKEDVWSI